MQRRVYFDSASTTKIHPDVLKTYKELLDRYYANSESLYDEGSEVHRMMEKARGAIAGLLGTAQDEIIFTSGSSESNSAAIKGTAFAQKNKKHIITTNVEHSSIMNACRQLEEVFGYEVTYLPVNSDATVSVDDVRKALRPDTCIVSVMAVNNEVGAINPIEEIAEMVKKESHAFFHTDLTQAIGKVDIDMKNIDLASVSAHKLHGLKGSGILVKKRHVPFIPLINGGEQEGGLRGGTSNALVNMVFAKTLRLAMEEGKKNRQNLQELKDYFVAQLNSVDGILINHPLHSICSTINFSYEKIPSEVMQNALNAKGFMVSARSTCDSRNTAPSYVLQAMGYSDARASSCIRVSLSSENTKEDADDFIRSLKEIIQHYG